MNIISKKYNFLKPHVCKNLKRIGRNQDGGYVVNIESILNNKILVSFGLGLDWSFELEFLRINKLGKVYIFDNSINIFTFFLPFLKCLKRFLTFRKNLNDIKNRASDMFEYLSFISKKNVFFSKKTIGLNSEKNEISLKNVLDNIKSEQKLILKIDIEGTEYDLIEEILQSSSRLDLLIIEFHNTDLNESNFTKSINSLQKFFNIIHLHGNNHCGVGRSGIPEAIEITFLNKIHDLPQNMGKANYPLKDLDFPNNPNTKDIFFGFN
tara:strand:- start:3777 stop:4574 length:798 start_codon:yes stop_codon:yes gene_type:complete